MARNRLIHSTSGVQLARKMAEEGYRIFTSKQAQEVAPSVGLRVGYLRQALYHLVRSGWLVRLRNGLYALTSAVPGTIPLHEFEIAMVLAKPAAISHWSAMHHHGLTEQIPRRVFVLTTTEAFVPRVRSRSKKRTETGYPILATNYQFIQVTPERYFGVEKVWVGEARVTITDIERTLLDGLMMPQYCGDFAEVLHAFQVRLSQLDINRMISYALKLDAATVKRLGWVLQHQGVDQSRLKRLVRLPIKGYRLLDPTGPPKGPCDRHWMIQVNTSRK